MGDDGKNLTTGCLGGKVAVVTGAAGNLGPVWIEKLLSEGAQVYALTYPGTHHDPSLAQFVGHPDVHLFTCDVTSRSGLEAAAQEIFGVEGGPDVLVANAGIDQPPSGGGVSTLEGFDAAAFTRVLDVNVLGVFQSLQVFGSRMARRKSGSIVLIGSLYGSVSPDPSFYDHLSPPFVKPPAYGASKAAVIQMAKYFSVFWGPVHVRVNVLSPGGIFGNQDKEFVRKYTRRVPLGRMASPEDLGGPLIFLASCQSRYITGINLTVDGGFTAL